MIEYNRESLWAVVCQCSGSVIQRIWMYVLLAMLEAFGVALLKVHMREHYFITVSHPWSVVGSALGFLLVFRTNLSYNRFWTGRTMLTEMLKAARELMRMTVAYTGKYKRGEDGRVTQEDNEFLVECRDEIRRLIEALFFCIIMLLQRTGDSVAMTPQELSEDVGWLVHEKMLTPAEAKILLEVKVYRGSCVAPSIIATWITGKVKQFCDLGYGPPPPIHAKMDNLIGAFISGWMTCETINNTPLVFPYNQLLGACLMSFIFTIPLPLANEFYHLGPGEVATTLDTVIVIVPTVLMTGLIALTFFGINAIGMEIENPFGNDLNDLPLAEMAARVPFGTGSLLALRAEKHSSSIARTQSTAANDVRVRQRGENALYISFKKQLKNLSRELVSHHSHRHELHSTGTGTDDAPPRNAFGTPLISANSFSTSERTIYDVENARGQRFY